MTKRIFTVFLALAPLVACAPDPDAELALAAHNAETFADKMFPGQDVTFTCTAGSRYLGWSTCTFRVDGELHLFECASRPREAGCRLPVCDGRD